MPTLFSMRRLYHYAQNYACIIYLTLNFSWVLQGGGGRKQGALWSM